MQDLFGPPSHRFTVRRTVFQPSASATFFPAPCGGRCSLLLETLRQFHLLSTLRQFHLSAGDASPVPSARLLETLRQFHLLETLRQFHHDARDEASDEQEHANREFCLPCCLFEKKLASVPTPPLKTLSANYFPLRQRASARTRKAGGRVRTKQGRRTSTGKVSFFAAWLSTENSLCQLTLAGS